METKIVTRLAALFASSQLDVAAYFRQCAVAGISFAAALAAVSGTPAWAAQMPKTAAPTSYTAFVPADLLDLYKASAAIDDQECSTCPFSKAFDKAFDKAFEKFGKAPFVKVSKPNF